MLKTNHKLGSESGMIFIASTMGVFIILSLFAFYLARFSITESRTGGYHMVDIKARNLAMTGIEHGIQLFKPSRSISALSGSFNTGDYTVTFDTLNNESGSSLPYSNYLTIKSKATINDVERNLRLILSSMPEAFCFSYYGNNLGLVTFNENQGTISGDMYHNGNVSTNIVSSGIKYSSTGSGGTQLISPPSFPTLVTTSYEALLTSAGLATGSYTNYALHFDSSSDQVYIPNHSDINLGTHTQRTVEAWFRVDDKTRTHKQTIYEEGGGVRGLNIYIHTDGTLYGGAWNEPGGESNWNGHWIGWNNVQDNTWYHVAVTLNGGSSITSNAVKMYVDGQLISTGSGSQLWGHSGNNMIGRNGNTKFHTGDDNSSGESFYGDIDEVRIWNVERTASQIDDAKDGILNGDETDLVTYYNFQENSGITANDSQTLSNNDGTISNASWTSGPNLSDMSGSSYTNTTLNLSESENNQLLVNSNLTLSNVTVNGPGSIAVDGNLTIESGSVIKKNVSLICAGNLTVSSSQIGLTIRKPAIVYSKGTTSITGSTVNGILIAKGNACTLSSTVVNGAILNYGSSFTLGSNSDVVGSVVSNHSVDILDGSSSITKGNLPPFFGLNIGLDPIVVPGSYLEY
jgi:hypothetical protein